MYGHNNNLIILINDMLIFKQKVLKVEVFKFILINLCGLLCIVVINTIANIHEGVQPISWADLVAILPLYLLIFFPSLYSLERFEVYSDRIEVKYFLGTKNVVYFKNVIFIEQVKINHTSLGIYTDFYIFNDGRKNNNSPLKRDSCYNIKRYNLRIYKTESMEKFIKKYLYELQNK